MTQRDEVLEHILESGYVRNTKLHRRWIAAQTLSAIRYPGGFDRWLSNCTGSYVIRTLKEEVNVLRHLENEDTELFKERSAFFTKEVIYETFNHYGRDIPEILTANNYTEIWRSIRTVRVRFKRNQSKPQAWVDAFKGAGAYYTLKNLIMWDGVRIEGLNRNASLELLEKKKVEYNGKWYLLHNMMKKVVKDFNLRDFINRAQ